jgi:hypothetical protein
MAFEIKDLMVVVLPRSGRTRQCAVNSAAVTQVLCGACTQFTSKARQPAGCGVCTNYTCRRACGACTRCTKCTGGTPCGPCTNVTARSECRPVSAPDAGCDGRLSYDRKLGMLILELRATRRRRR